MVKFYLRGLLIFLAAVMSAGIFCFSHPAVAQTGVNVWGDEYAGATVGLEAFKVIGLGSRSPQLIIASVIQIALGFLGILAVVLILYGGFLWMNSQGDNEKIKKAKDLLRNSVIGLLIILSAFATATFILRALIGSGGGSGGGFGGGNGGGGALSAMGGGVISSVYPAPNQRDVPRNTAVIVTFKEVMDPGTICDKVINGKCDVGAKVLPTSVKIFQTNQGNKALSDAADATVTSVDNKTFMFTPSAYLGSPTDKIWYTVGLTTKILKAGGNQAFSISGFAWQFEIADILDLTPPRVVSAGVFPAPDNASDQPGQVTDAIASQAALTVNARPGIVRQWRVTYTKTNPASVDLNIANPNNNVCDGQIVIAINNSNPPTANIAYRNLPGRVNMTEAPIINRVIKTSCGFDIGLLRDQDNFTPGQAWTIDLATARNADKLIVGSDSYVFVNKVTAAKQILVDPDTAVIAANIAQALIDNKDISAVIDGKDKNKINLTAKVGGRAGNLLELLSSAVKDTLTITAFAGGVDRAVSVKVMDKRDKPKNSIIQINFSEAINPIALSGRSEALVKNIRVINAVDGSVVAGEFRLSNQYQTVEFIPDLACGMNACGDKVFCLPGNAQVKVELTAAALSATCVGDSDCASKAPFAACKQGICYDSANTAFYPEGRLGSGILDLANNSLDGNRDTKAIGPVDYYSDNSATGAGDNFTWSFWTSDLLDLTPPQIDSITPTYNENQVGLNDPIKIKFSKLMLAASLSSGSVNGRQGDKNVTHQLINLRSLAGAPVGYWLAVVNQESSNPPDNEPDQTMVLLNHSPLAGLSKYRAQVGSGVKDIYQNCYKPCAGPSCDANSVASSCCNGAATDLGLKNICPD